MLCAKRCDLFHCARERCSLSNCYSLPREFSFHLTPLTCFKKEANTGSTSPNSQCFPKCLDYYYPLVSAYLRFAFPAAWHCYHEHVSYSQLSCLHWEFSPQMSYKCTVLRLNGFTIPLTQRSGSVRSLLLSRITLQGKSRA